MPGEVSNITLGEPASTAPTLSEPAATDRGTLSPLFDLRVIDDSQVPTEDTEAGAPPQKTTQPSEAPSPGTEAGAGNDQESLDAELMRIMMDEGTPQETGTEQTPGQPAGVDEATWQQFQAWQQLQQQPGQAQEQQPAAGEPPAVPLQEGPVFQNDEEFENFFSDRNVAEQVMGRVASQALQRLGGQVPTTQAVQQQVDQAMEHAYYTGLRTSELMLYVHDAARDNPQIYEHPKAFQAALSRLLNASPDGDTQQIVDRATEAYMRTYRSKQGVENTVKAGRKVDVRGEQKPHGMKPLPRQVTGESGQPDMGTLNPLFNLWRKP